MQCTCGFENAADAKFCGKCRLALGDGTGNAVPSVPAPAAGVPTRATKAVGRGLSRATLAILAVVAVLAAAGYWWLNQPPGGYIPDNSGLYPIKVDGKYGYMDRTGKTVLAPQFDDVRLFSEGLAGVRVGNKWGYINTEGALVITPQFDSLDSGFRFGRACVAQGARWGFIDREGKYIHTPDLVWAGPFSGNLAPVATAGGDAAFLDRSGKLVMVGTFEAVAGFFAGLAAARSGGKWGYIDARGEWVIDPQFEEARNFADGLASVQVGGRWGYIDRKGKFVINPQYDVGGDFSEGYADVISGHAFSFIDTTGRMTDDTKFTAVGHFSDGLAPVKTEEGWGYIDTKGNMVISPQFDDAGLFQDGLARVTLAGKEAYVTTTGAFVVDPFPDRGAVPSHPVQEVWEGYVKFSEDSKSAVRFVLVRNGAQIRGFSSTDSDGRVGLAYDLEGQTAQDGSFSIVDELGRAWKGQFASALVIQGSWVKPNLALAEAPMRLRLVRDATAQETEPLPPTTSEWSAFLSNFKDAVQQRNLRLLSQLAARSFNDANSALLTRPPATVEQELTQVRWAEVALALAQGLESASTTPLGRAKRVILEEPRRPDIPYRVRLTFVQDGDNQWRWAYIDYPFD